MRLNCPRCNGERIINYEDIIECLDCDLEFEKKDFELIEDKSNILATTRYGNIEFASIVFNDSIVATQFHPEKSGKNGIKIFI